MGRDDMTCSLLGLNWGRWRQEKDVWCKKKLRRCISWSRDYMFSGKKKTSTIHAETNFLPETKKH